MKTARGIEEQEERKKARDNGQTSPELTQSVTRKSRRGDASRIAAWRWQPGKSANPGGVPKRDVAKEIAEAIFPNLAQRLGGSELAEQHGHKLSPTAEAACVPFGLVLAHRRIKTGSRN